MDNYTETLNYIHSLGMYSNPPHTDLSKIKYLCSLFGDPQNSYKTIHIAGTNGKGSAAAMLSNILTELGYKTGRFISPFIENFNERISVDNSDISEEDIVYHAGKIRKTLENLESKFMPNEFEFITLLAFLYYREKNCGIAVIETGLGGTLDPTNAIKSPLCSVIMSIGLDHMKLLGDTIEEIAVWKCGIIKQNSPVVLYPLNKESVIDIVKNTAREKNSEFIMPDIKDLKILEENIDFTRFEYKGKAYKTRLAGRHQVYNAITVIETVGATLAVVPGSQSTHTHTRSDSRATARVAPTNNYNAVYNGIEKTFFPARFEILSKDPAKPTVIFDGAHNIPAVSVLKETVKNLLPDKKIILICGMLKEKKPEEALAAICAEPFIYKFTAVPVNSPRSETPGALCGYAAKYCKNAGYNHDLREAIKNALSESESEGKNPADFAIICFGSLYLAGDVKKIVRSLL